MKTKNTFKILGTIYLLLICAKGISQNANYNSGGLATNNVTFSVGEIYVVETIEPVNLAVEEHRNVIINAHPNPSVDYVEISSTDAITISTIAIHDINGRLLFIRKVENSQLVLSDLPSGVYLLSSPAKEFNTFKIIKK